MQKTRIIVSLFLVLTGVQFSFAQQHHSGYFTSFDSTRIYYETVGAGRPVLLIHGFTGTLADWKKKPIYDSLLNNGFQVIVTDLRGNGQSDQPDQASRFANNAEAMDLMGLMKFLQINQYEAIGYSRGSIILASLLVMDDHCTKAVLGGMGADFTNPNWPRRIGFYQALMNDSIKGYEGFRQYIAGKKLNPTVLAWQQLYQPSTSAAALAALQQQVLVICGNADTDNGKGTDLQQLIPHASYAEVPGDHNSASNTSQFAERIMKFLLDK